ncbi:conserved hypothetical protein [Ricinus communis]|uniref:Uncharacterized protein n=1 Tax=Ricinus communis TaxID=3988 RepID=B9T0G7_RICCO|nr:conserved hypothetical protein [Ricinus communis]
MGIYPSRRCTEEQNELHISLFYLIRDRGLIVPASAAMQWKGRSLNRPPSFFSKKKSSTKRLDSRMRLSSHRPMA